MGRTKNRHNRDLIYENSLLRDIAELYHGGELSPRDRLIIEAASHSKRQMNLLHFADSEELVDWCTYCHLVEMDEYWNSEDREAWRVVWKLLWEKLFRVVRYGQGYNKRSYGQGVKKRAKGGPSKAFPAKEVLQFDLEGNLIRRWRSGHQAARGLGISKQSVSKCCNGLMSRCGQWRFKFADDINTENDTDVKVPERG